MATRFRHLLWTRRCCHALTIQRRSFARMPCAQSMFNLINSIHDRYHVLLQVIMRACKCIRTCTIQYLDLQQALVFRGLICEYIHVNCILHIAILGTNCKEGKKSTNDRQVHSGFKNKKVQTKLEKHGHPRNQKTRKNGERERERERTTWEAVKKCHWLTWTT
jgi:hypothetical protein